jgi:thymidylate kinase
MNRGFFFVIEGIDGAGKSTVCTMVAEKLCAAGRDLCVMREPTSGQYGRRVRQLIAAAQSRTGVFADCFRRTAKKMPR